MMIMASAVTERRSARQSPVITSSADHVVGGLAVAQSARAAGVVADHPADRAAVVGRWIWPEPQPVRRRRHLQRRLHHTGLDAGCRASGSIVEDGVQVARGIQDQSGADCVAAHDVPAPRVVTGMPTARAASSTRRGLLDRPWPGDRLGHDPVERGIGGVEGAGELGGVEDASDARRRSCEASSSTSGESATVFA